MKRYRVPKTEDLLANVPVYADHVIGEAVAILRPGDEDYEDYLPFCETQAPAEEFPLIRELYAARGLTSPV